MTQGKPHKTLRRFLYEHSPMAESLLRQFDQIYSEIPDKDLADFPTAQEAAYAISGIIFRENAGKIVLGLQTMSCIFSYISERDEMILTQQKEESKNGK